ncbi:MAG: RHS repeat-associated core domain-containing protein [Acetobacteraceae bacterium]|nr:RHS repeat-associated core domain-containing protein [Acetobacteraceae bacterium]
MKRVLFHFTYATTPEYDFASIAESLGSQTWQYGYDTADRLTGATSSLGPNYGYGYDAASNPTAIATPSGSSTVTPNVTNAVANVGAQAFTCDANGNLLADATRTYTWDAENRLIGIGYPANPGSSTTFRYDGLSRRVAIVTTAAGVNGEIDYGWCGEALCQARSASGSATRRYFAEGEWDIADALQLYYGRDHLGSVRDVISLPGGVTANHFDYDPYGTPITATGAAVSTTDFRWAGLFYHPQSGLYLATYRAYDPGSGRWVSRDPIGEAGGINLYAYAGGDPINFIDPFGLGRVVK